MGREVKVVGRAGAGAMVVREELEETVEGAWGVEEKATGR